MLNPNSTPSEYNLKTVRALYDLDGGTIPVNDFAKRPPCSRCGKSVVGRSFHHRPEGVICHQCLFGTVPSYIVRTYPDRSGMPTKKKYRPTHPCMDCQRPVSEKKSPRCKSCAAVFREAQRAKNRG